MEHSNKPEQCIWKVQSNLINVGYPLGQVQRWGSLQANYVIQVVEILAFRYHANYTLGILFPNAIYSYFSVERQDVEVRHEDEATICSMIEGSLSKHTMGHSKLKLKMSAA